MLAKRAVEVRIELPKGSAEAEDNLKFLSSLEKPCQALAEADPKDIPPILPKLLYCIRMIWNISRFYNTPERLAGLLRKVSNEIINRCCDKLSLEEIFEGDVESCMSGLRESIRAGETWKRAYQVTAEAVRTRSAHPWDFDVSSIFAHIDAFVQRCRDMMEVCEAQLQFAPRGEIPTFGAPAGPRSASPSATSRSRSRSWWPKTCRCITPMHFLITPSLRMPLATRRWASGQQCLRLIVSI